MVCVTRLKLKYLLLKKRSKEKEFIDLGASFYSSKEYIHCQNTLFKINRLLGIFSYSKSIIKQLQPVSVLDVGCGGGLFALNLGAYFAQMHFMGCDISPEAIGMAAQQLKIKQQNNVSFNLQSQLKLDLPENSVDILITTLVCHHIEDSELVDFLQDTLRISRKAVLINDLHRHIIPYLFYKLFSPIFGNRLINHDGLISIKRGFIRNDWTSLLERAQIDHFTIKWRFPFWWSVILWKK
jgi:ubiquinone/menaquinone biosynthesis C-methylase UbiE